MGSNIIIPGQNNGGSGGDLENRVSISRRGLLFGAAAGAVAIATAPLEALAKELQATDELVNIYEDVASMDSVSATNKALVLMKRLNDNYLGYKARVVSGTFTSNDGTKEETKWVEYYTGERFYVLNPERGIISPNNVVYFDGSHQPHYNGSESKTFKEVHDNRTRMLRGEGILLTTEKTMPIVYEKDTRIPPEQVGRDNPKPDYWQSPDETRTRKKGDCDDQTILLADEFGIIGIDGAKIAYGLLNGDDEKSAHLYLLYTPTRHPGKIYVIEATKSEILRKENLEDRWYQKRVLGTDLGNEFDRMLDRATPEQRGRLFLAA